MSRDLTQLIPQTKRKVDKILAWAKEEGYTLIVTSTFRSFAEQQTLYNQGRTKPGKRVTNAKPGQSFHNVRRAVDFVFVVNGKAVWDENFEGWSRLGMWAARADLSWGGNWTKIVDLPHVEDQWCEKCEDYHHKATSFEESGECRVT